MTIRDGSAKDLVDVAELSAKVFFEYGDYRQVLPDYLLSDHVRTFICEEEGLFVGFLQVALEPEGRSETDPPLWADVVGIENRDFDYYHGETMNVYPTGVAHPITAGLSP